MRDLIFITSVFIRIISILYVLIPISFFAAASFFPAILLLLLLTNVLPITGFGLPVFEGIGCGFIPGEECPQHDIKLSPFLIIPFILGILAFWSGVEIARLRVRGLIVYSVIVSILLVGALFDAKNNLLEVSGFHPMLFVFLFSMILLWYGFWKLKFLGRSPRTNKKVA